MLNQPQWMHDEWKNSFLARKIEADVRRFIDGLDHSVLGIFAVDEDELYYAMVAIRVGFFGAEASGISEITMQDMNKHVTHKAAIEAEFWQEDFLPVSDMESFGKLMVVSSHPVAFHPYFERGFWDVDKVAGFVANDIDFEMASKL